MLIEFPPMVANEVVRLQTDTPGCKSSGTVARHFCLKKLSGFSYASLQSILLSSKANSNTPPLCGGVLGPERLKLTYSFRN